MVVVLISFVAFLLIAEQLFPLRERRRPLGHRWFVNAVFSAIAYVGVALIGKPLLTSMIKGSSGRPLSQAGLGFLLLDLSFYYWHRLNHRVNFLWRFHQVHHTDPDLDLSTGFRFHLGEVLLSLLFRLFQIFIVGLPTFLFYEGFFQACVYFHHSNWRLTEGVDRALRAIIVTPRMHGMHHSQIPEETDSNYSVIFSFWDHLHRTFKPIRPMKNLVIGVGEYDREKDNDLKKLLRMPFQRLAGES